MLPLISIMAGRKVREACVTGDMFLRYECLSEFVLSQCVYICMRFNFRFSPTQNHFLPEAYEF